MFFCHIANYATINCIDAQTSHILSTYPYLSERIRGGCHMQTFITNQNQVEKIDGMTIEFPYCMHERNLTDFVVP